MKERKKKRNEINHETQKEFRIKRDTMYRVIGILNEQKEKQ